MSTTNPQFADICALLDQLVPTSDNNIEFCASLGVLAQRKGAAQQLCDAGSFHSPYDE